MWDEAETEVRSLREHHLLDDESAAPYRAAILIGKGEYEEALNLAEAQSWQKLDSVRAIALARLGRFSTATSAGERAFKQREQMAPCALGDVARLQNNRVNAIEWYDKGLHGFARAAALRRLGRCLMELEEWREAAAVQALLIRAEHRLQDRDVKCYALACDVVGRPAEAAAVLAVLRQRSSSSGGSA